MALVTTNGSSSANSFITVDEADAHIAASSYVTSAWDELTDTEKENLLLLAAKVMQNMGWYKWPVYKNQALPFPRWDAEDAADHVSGDEVEIPDDIKKAQAYIAYDVIYRGLQSGENNPADGPASDAISRLNLFGEVSITMATGEVPLADGSAWSRIIKGKHFAIDLLLNEWLTDFYWTSGISDEDAPALLDEVA